jgi:hypothetical protein
MKKRKQGRKIIFLIPVALFGHLTILGCSAKSDFASNHGFSTFYSENPYNKAFYNDKPYIPQRESTTKDNNELNTLLTEDPSSHDNIKISSTELSRLERNKKERIDTLIKENTDRISKILNYSDGITENRYSYETWIKVGACEYKKVNNESGATRSTINLNDIDPRYLKVVVFNRTSSEVEPIRSYNNYTEIVGYNNVVHEYQTNDVVYDGKSIFSSRNTEIDRIRSAWKEIYSKHCKGQRVEF